MIGVRDPRRKISPGQVGDLPRIRVAEPVKTAPDFPTRFHPTQTRSVGRSVAHGVSRGVKAQFEKLAAERRHIENHARMFRPSGARFSNAANPMAYAMGYRSSAAPRLKLF